MPDIGRSRSGKSKNGRDKSVKLSAQPDPKKRVAMPPALPVMQRELRIRFHRLDLGGPWCLTKISESDHLTLLKAVRQWETMQLSQVFNGQIGKDEDVVTASPNPRARARAAEVYPDDADQIARLRLGNMKRLWGLRYEHEFHAIWWDPEHDVWPSA